MMLTSYSNCIFESVVIEMLPPFFNFFELSLLLSEVVSLDEGAAM